MTVLDGSTGVVTGASGFIGRAVLRALPASARVYAIYNSDRTFTAWVEGCEADVVPVCLDLRDARLADHVPSVDWSLLLAARVSTVTSWDDPIGELKAVAGVTANSIIGLRSTRVVHVSSGSVYEGLTGQLNPDRVPSPKLPYSIAKLSAELLFQAYCHAPWWNLRFFGAYGPGEPDFKLIRRLVVAFVGGDATFRLRGTGSNRLDPMYIDDAAAVLTSFLGTLPRRRTLDVCQGDSLTVHDFAEMAFATVHPDPESGPLRLDLSGQAHEQILGVARPAQDDEVPVTRRSLATGLREYAGWLTRSGIPERSESPDA